MTTRLPVGRGMKIAAAVAVAFGALTLLSGALALFGGPDAAAAVGDAVPFVLWFNFLSGAAYVLAGIGIYLGRSWGTMLAWLLAACLVVVFAAFGWHVRSGGAYEVRTVGAMILRSAFWIGMAMALGRPRPDTSTGASRG